MGTGGSRYGAGRPGWRRKAEQSLPLDIRRMHRAGALEAWRAGGWVWTNNYTGEESGRIGYASDGDALTLDYTADGEPKHQRIAIMRTGCHYGGSRPWFGCPMCWRRVAVLYYRAGRFACRHCNRIAYLTQSYDATGRAWRKQSKIEARLGEDCERPKGMHATTYERLLGNLEECETVRNYAMIQALARMGLTL